MAVGNLSALAVNSFMNNGESFSDHQSLLDSLLPRLNANVTVLIKGSRSAGMDNLVRLLQI